MDDQHTANDSTLVLAQGIGISIPAAGVSTLALTRANTLQHAPLPARRHLPARSATHLLPPPPPRASSPAAQRRLCPAHAHKHLSRHSVGMGGCMDQRQHRAPGMAEYVELRIAQVATPWQAATPTMSAKVLPSWRDRGPLGGADSGQGPSAPALRRLLRQPHAGRASEGAGGAKRGAAWAWAWAWPWTRFRPRARASGTPSAWTGGSFRTCFAGSGGWSG